MPPGGVTPLAGSGPKPEGPNLNAPRVLHGAERWGSSSSPASEFDYLFEFFTDLIKQAEGLAGYSYLAARAADVTASYVAFSRSKDWPQRLSVLWLLYRSFFPSVRPQFKEFAEYLKRECGIKV